MKKQNFIISPFLLMGIFMVLAIGCKKDEVIDVLKQTPILTTAEVTKIGQITAQCGGGITSDANFVVNARGVCWNKTGNPTTLDNKTTDGAGAGSFTSKLTGLTIGTTYYLRAYATNSEGTSYGSTMVFQTLGNTFTDSRDGNVYKIITIGDQIWMAENLKYLPSVESPEATSNTTPYHYVYGYEEIDVTEAKATDNYDTYGVLYNWEAAKAACPPGWHLPSDAEWTQLTTYLGGKSVAGGKLKETGISHWNAPNTGSTNESGFTALPGGIRFHDGTFQNMGKVGYWWSVSEDDPGKAWSRYQDSQVYIIRLTYQKEQGFSVRCVKD